MPNLNEADTCRKYVLPKLLASGWDNEPHSFTSNVLSPMAGSSSLGEKSIGEGRNVLTTVSDTPLPPIPIHLPYFL